MIYRLSSSTSHILKIRYRQMTVASPTSTLVSYNENVLSCWRHETDLLECQTRFPAVFLAACAALLSQSDSCKNGNSPKALGIRRVHCSASDRQRRARRVPFSSLIPDCTACCSSVFLTVLRSFHLFIASRRSQSGPQQYRGPITFIITKHHWTPI